MPGARFLFPNKFFCCRQDAQLAGFPGEAPLEIGPIGRGHGAVAAQLDAGSLDEIAGRHDDGAFVAGHIPGLRGDVAVHGAAVLDARAEPLQQLPFAEVDGLDNVGPLRIPAGEGLITQVFQQSGGKDRRFQRLGDGMGSQEQALEKPARRRDS